MDHTEPYCRILLTGFDPFGGETVNPALEAVKRVQCPGLSVIPLEVPTAFGRAEETVIQAIMAHQPQLVICVGQAAGRAVITPERVAINVDDARIPDNAGAQPQDRPIDPAGPAAYFSTLPIRAMVQAIRQAGVPADISNSAGTFVCNHLMYSVLHYAAKACPGLRAGFVHVPCIPAQTEGSALPSLPLEDIVRGLEAAVLAAAQAL